MKISAFLQSAARCLYHHRKNEEAWAATAAKQFRISVRAHNITIFDNLRLDCVAARLRTLYSYWFNLKNLKLNSLPKKVISDRCSFRYLFRVHLGLAEHFATGGTLFVLSQNLYQLLESQQKTVGTVRFLSETSINEAKTKTDRTDGNRCSGSIGSGIAISTHACARSLRVFPREE